VLLPTPGMPMRDTVRKVVSGTFMICVVHKNAIIPPCQPVSKGNFALTGARFTRATVRRSAAARAIMSLRHTPLDALHRELGARMVPFAGYDMPVQYSDGIIAEHRHTRAAAGLFDVSHMGQLLLSGPGIAATLESLMPADLLSLGEHRQTYSLLTNDAGGVRDDLIVTRWDAEHVLPGGECGLQGRGPGLDRVTACSPAQRLEVLEAQALLALQGPGARAVLKTCSRTWPRCRFCTAATSSWMG
jgi:glycine cleavage system aminomethyltransferase T